MTYQCPVCGFSSLAAPPRDYYICPCCGTEFGNDDTLYTFSELRRRWINRGLVWFSRFTPPPRDWNPFIQLSAAGLSAFPSLPNAALLFSIG